jgi:2,3,4,5-tetrahydropyridine-2,6-dicarboxylate N-succinyltransferase
MFGGDVNVGAYVGAGTMVDGGARVGSCAQVGERVHISGGAGIGGVLEPPQARPTIVEDRVLLGANSEVAEGVIVREGAVIAPGMQITGSTKIVDRDSGQVLQGEVPANAVVVGGALPVDRERYPNAPEGLMVDCGVIVKYADEQTRAKTSLNDLLRE